MAPRDVANKVLEKVPKNEIIEKLDVAGPGFVNIFISKSFVNAQINDILKYGVRAPFLIQEAKGQKVCNFSKHCPNPLYIFDNLFFFKNNR